MGNERNNKTTHPKIRARRESALARLERGIKLDGKPYKEVSRERDLIALHRKLGQRKQGSAT